MKFYLVMVESYDYECGWQEPDKAFSKKEDAQNYIDKMNKAIKEFLKEKEKITKLQTKEQQPYLEKIYLHKGKMNNKLLDEYRKVCKKWQAEIQKLEDKYGMMGYVDAEVEYTISEFELE